MSQTQNSPGNISPPEQNKDQKCICHTTDACDQTVAFSNTSWSTFKKAAEIRGDLIHKKMKEKWGEGPFHGFHRRCYQAYTHPKTLKNLWRKAPKRNI